MCRYAWNLWKATGAPRTLEPLVMFGLRVICFKMPQRNFTMCQSIKLQAFTKDIGNSKALPLAGTNSPYRKSAITQTNTIGHWNGPDVLAHSNWPTNFSLQNTSKHHDIILISHYIITHTHTCQYIYIYTHTLLLFETFPSISDRWLEVKWSQSTVSPRVDWFSAGGYARFFDQHPTVLRWAVAKAENVTPPRKHIVEAVGVDLGLASEECIVNWV